MSQSEQLQTRQWVLAFRDVTLRDARRKAADLESAIGGAEL